MIKFRDLVPTFRSSCSASASTFHELRKVVVTNKLKIPVPPLHSKFLDGICRLQRRNFQWAALAWTVTTAAGLMLAASQSFAQQPYEADQPGLIADDSYQLDPEWQKQMVFFRTTEPPGTIIISTAERHLYLVQPGGRALRYGIGVGRDGFQWQGLLNITRKAEWPDWVPPPEMIERQPYLPRFMAGGPGNPLGARAMYLGTTVYRIHGTNRPDTIGTKVSSGCFRLVNADVADLYERVPVGTKVVVRQKPEL
jgi:lipoprotein-anchoring transpeptidase ErfK/SrfK